MRKKDLPLSPIGEILRDQLHSRGWENKLEEQKVFSVWAEAVGDQVAEKATPRSIEKGRLTVVVSNPVWAQQLSLMKRDLLKKISKTIGEGLVKDLYFVSGTIQRETPSPEKPPLKLIPPDPETIAEIEREASSISDPSLRRAFRNLRVASLRRRSG